MPHDIMKNKGLNVVDALFGLPEVDTADDIQFNVLYQTLRHVPCSTLPSAADLASLQPMDSVHGASAAVGESSSSAQSSRSVPPS